METALMTSVNNGKTTGKDLVTGRFVAGNKLGRGNKGAKWLSTALADALMERAGGTQEQLGTLIIARVIHNALRGDINAIKLIFDRVEGSVPKTVDFKEERIDVRLTEAQKAKLLALLG